MELERKVDQLINLVEAWIERAEADGCLGCAFEETEEWEMPCAECKRACKDYWRYKEADCDTEES